MQTDHGTEAHYYFGLSVGDDGRPALEAVKTWLVDDERQFAAQTIATYGTYENAIEDERELNTLHHEQGLEAAMNLAEAMAVADGHLLDERADGRLFTDGPPDPFRTIAEQERLMFLALADEDTAPIAPLTDESMDDTQEAPARTGTWDELVALNQNVPEPDAPEAHYWQMHYRPVETSDGERLGTALFVTEFPQLPPDFDQQYDENGMDDATYPTEARMVEMAHFANDEDARKFEAEFRSYLVPGLLEAAELAPEVAKLEGLSGAWEAMDEQGIVHYMRGDRTVVREVDEWQLHNPYAEREAQEHIENPHNDINL